MWAEIRGCYVNRKNPEQADTSHKQWRYMRLIEPKERGMKFTAKRQKKKDVYSSSKIMQ